MSQSMSALVFILYSDFNSVNLTNAKYNGFQRISDQTGRPATGQHSKPTVKWVIHRNLR